MAEANQIVEELLNEFRVTDKVLAAYSSRGSYADVSSRLSDYLYDENKDIRTGAANILRLMTLAGRKALSLVKAPHVDEKYLLGSLLSTYDNKFDRIDSPQDFFPVPVYVSSSKTDRDVVGLLVHWNGKIEEFEGNDEASPETLDLVDRLLGKAGKEVVVWGSHGSGVVDRILATKTLPAGLYVSPSKSHASGYWGKDRVLFSTTVRFGDVARESEVDWKVRHNTKVSKVRVW